jgi:signal-transduction protein with cAMP-binding, CBS, and nucleotidyltransferase domain
MLLSRNAMERDRLAARRTLEDLDRILRSFPVPGFPDPPARSAGRCLDESGVGEVADGSLDLIAEWCDARPLAGPLDPGLFRRLLSDALKEPEHLRRAFIQARSRMPRGLFRGMVVRADGRLDESIALEDLLFLPLRDLGRIAAILAGDRSSATPVRFLEAARQGVLPEEMARAATGAWTFGLRREVALGDPDVRPGEPSGTPMIRPRDLNPRDRRLVRDALGVIHRLAGLLERGPWSEGPWRY